MTTWTFSKDKSGLLITQQKEGKKPLKIGYAKSKDLGNALFEVSERFEPGDLVVTPEGTSLVYPRQGCLNN